MKCFESNEENFERDALFDRKPMKFMEYRRDVIILLSRGTHGTSKRVLNKLKFASGRVWQTKEKRVTEIKLRRDKSIR